MVARLAFALSAVLLLACPAMAEHHHGNSDAAVRIEAQARPPREATPQRPPAASPTTPGRPAPAPSAVAPSQSSMAGMQGGDPHTPRIFTLRSGIAEGRMVFLGVGGDI